MLLYRYQFIKNVSLKKTYIQFLLEIGPWLVFEDSNQEPELANSAIKIPL